LKISPKSLCTLPDGRVSAAVVVLIIGLTAIATYGQSQRRAAGIIYFTNNTPKDLRTFPVEILKGDTRVALTNPDEHYRFAFSNLKPGKYLLRLTWPKQCVLSYRLDLSRQSMEKIEVIMDVECAHHNGEIRDLPANQPAPN
jgi:hypothetical protein